MSATCVDVLPSPLSPTSRSVVQATAAVVAEHAEQITARFYPRMFEEHPRAAAGVQPGQPGHRRAEPGARGVGRGLRGAADRPGRAVVRPRDAAGSRTSTSRSGSARSSTRSSDTTCWPRSGRCSVTPSPPRSPRPGTRSTGCSPPSSSPRRPGCTSRRASTRRTRCARTAWSGASRRPTTSCRLVLEPADGGALPKIGPGQYVSVFVDLPGRRAPAAPVHRLLHRRSGTRLQITVRRVQGRRTAHRTAWSPRSCTTRSAVGDLLDVSAPAGDFVVRVL